MNRFRRVLYQNHFLKTASVSIPSVLVGNLQAGGAGKTPVVIEIAKHAVKLGKKVAIVSRGYGAKFSSPFLIVQANDSDATDPEKIGDEPAEILSEVPEVTLGLGADRLTVIQELEKRGINFLIFDDGFQNLKFKAHFTVLVVTSAKRNEVVYRDFDSAVTQADLVLQSKGGRDPRWGKNAVSLQWSSETLPAKPIWLLCGVADPTEVAHFYRNLGVSIQKVISHKDHVNYNLRTVETLLDDAKGEGCLLAVTPKDAVKLRTVNLSSLFVLKRKIQNTDWLDPIFKR